LAKDDAKKIYEEEKQNGNQAGTASKHGYEKFEFRVAKVEPGQNNIVRFVYFQSLDIDTGIGRYHYPLEEGGTEDPAATSFWNRNEKVKNVFSVHVSLKSAWPVADIRAPGYSGDAKTEKKDENTYELTLNKADASLNKDFVFYYRLADNLPGRVELIPFRDNEKEPGTFMMVVTPGADLKPLQAGKDFVFVLDLSGSMSGKMTSLIAGVGRSLKKLNPQDRFRLITFSDRADELTSGFVSVTPKNIEKYAKRVARLQASGSTNLYEGLELGLKGLDADRATSMVLLTDAVTNTGIVDPKKFESLITKHDLRFFGFLLGNSANWPLMQVLTDASGGFYKTVSNGDDIMGQVMLASDKLKHEAMHHFTLDIDGVGAVELTDVPKKLFYGQQLVVLGRYTKPGTAKLKMKARITGRDEVYETEAVFPKIAQDHPELERIWALAKIEKLTVEKELGRTPVTEATNAIRDLGLQYQLVTDETSMLVLSDESFKRRNIQRKNQQRLKREYAAQQRRVSRPARNYRVDKKKPAFRGRAPRGGGGALHPFAVLMGAGALISVLGTRRRKKTK
jgi:Ca-activated chloride channel family protein